MKKIIDKKDLIYFRKENGAKIPLFYLPVYEPQDRYALECWFFLLAPFVLLWRITINIFWSIWKDLLEFQRLQTYKYEK